MTSFPACKKHSLTCSGYVIEEKLLLYTNRKPGSPFRNPPLTVFQDSSYSEDTTMTSFRVCEETSLYRTRCAMEGMFLIEH